MPEKSWTILITDGFNESALPQMEAVAHVVNKPDIAGEDLMKALPSADAIIVRGRTKITADILAAAPNVKVIGRAGVGVDNIDLKAAQAKGVVVVNAPQSTTIAVAEHTLALMLSLARQIAIADGGLRKGEWLKKKLEGFELNGKTLGVIGMGRIGAGVAARATAFGVKCLGYDPQLSNEEITKRGATPVALDDLLATSDIVTIHVPLTSDTRGLLSAERLGKMKAGAVIICTARGNIIDEAALLAALDSGKLAGAGLDVFAQEPVVDSPLVKHPKVVCTPHIAAQTLEAQERASRDIAEEILTVLKGGTPRWRVA
jgi:D-3-phosphoglycerate dehydrogenase / 2-oxoglutarate reductase